MTLTAMFVGGCDNGGSSDEGTAEGSSTSGSASTTGTTGTLDPSTGSTTAVATTDAASSSSSTTDAGDSTSTGGEDGSSSTTGPVCDPGTNNCVCDDQGGCEGSLECLDDVCLDPAGCQGKQVDTEPNNDEGSAQAANDVTCGQLTAVEGSTEVEDEDYFTFTITDQGDDCPASDGTIAIVTADQPLEVCMFFSCDAGASSVNCPNADEVTSPDGLTGCCGIGSVEPDFFCTGVTNDGTGVLRVGGQETQACVDYELAYRVL